MTPFEELRAANRLHLAEVDVAMRALSELAAAQGTPVRCGPGCKACCRLYVQIGPLEAMEVADELRRQGRDTPSMRDRLSRAGRLMARKDADAYWAQGRYCALLAEDGRCSVYAARPFLCRTHTVVSDPAGCDRAIGDGIDVSQLKAEHAAFSAAAAACPELAGWPALGPLPALVARALACPHQIAVPCQ